MNISLFPYGIESLLIAEGYTPLRSRRIAACLGMIMSLGFDNAKSHYKYSTWQRNLAALEKQGLNRKTLAEQYTKPMRVYTAPKLGPPVASFDDIPF